MIRAGLAVTGLGLATLAGAATPAAPAAPATSAPSAAPAAPAVNDGLPPLCPAPGAGGWRLVERFIPADCPDCWHGEPPAARSGAAPDWFLDWVLPVADEDAPLAGAALREARDRVPDAVASASSAAPSPGPATPLERPHLLTRAPAQPRFWVRASPAWNGYFGVQMHAVGRWPAGSRAWLALVERLPAGSEGSGPARQLVRNLVGPLALPTAATPVPRGGGAPETAPLYALRWPETAQPERLITVAWVEAADGRILRLSSDRCR